MNAPRTPQLASPDAGQVPPDDDERLWYKDAVIYQLNVKAFFDSNDDGMGDFRGLASRLDYIRDLGVNTLWLMPFYPSPLKDDGYDIARYEEVHPQYGTLEDFQLMLDEAHRRGLRVVTELVINHTSDQHPWFQRARQAPPGSPERDFYVWSDTDRKYLGTRIIFTDTETSNWTWDPVAGAYYWHRFFSHQPDLNFDNPLVLEAVFKVMRFWLDRGVDGFRLDAIPYLVERDGTSNENLPETHAVIKQLRAAIDAHYPNRFLLAEANQWPEDVRDYFGDGDECHAAYHFPLMPRIYMAMAQEDRYPVVEIMQQTPEIPPTCQWAIFLRNHDELTLEMVTSKERDYMYSMYAADPRARINLGIRRRLAPLMDNDMDRIKLMNSLLLSMPGSPIIYYGDEIGMGDNVFIGDRNGVRTPMQWSPDRNAGFSRADPQRLYLPPIMDPVYGYESVNVEAQLRDPSSLLNWMRRMLAVRRTSHAFGRGSLTFLRPGNRKILAYLREHGEDTILCVANLSRSAQPVELNLSAYKSRVPVELLGRTTFPPIGELPYLLTLPAHGFYWFRLATDAAVPTWHEEVLPTEDRPVLVLFDGWNSLFRDHVVPWRIGLALKIREQFETDTLPRYIEAQRWYASKGEAVQRVRLVDQAIWEYGNHSWMLALTELDGPADRPRYFVPLALAWEEQDEERYRSVALNTAARIRQQANVGVVGDAFQDDAFTRAVMAALGQAREIPTVHGVIRFRPTDAFAELAGPDLPWLAIRKPQGQSSNTLVTLDERLFFKGYRRLREGMNPEYEIGRFLAEQARFPHCVPVAGVIEYEGSDGSRATLGIVQAYVPNQGDGWSYTLDYLERYLELRRASTEAVPPDVHGAYLALVRTLAERTAQLHLAFAQAHGDPAFEPEPLRAEDLASCAERAGTQARDTLDRLEAALQTLPPRVLPLARRVFERRDAVLQCIAQSAAAPQHGLRTRHHGDYHLAQVLLQRNDFIITDFEGEPGHSFEARREKQSPLKDVAGMLRSFSYVRAVALRQVAQTPEEHDALVPHAAEWEAQVRLAFLDAYHATAGSAGLYDTLTPGAGLLGLFELQKALYELRYELDHRPDWVEIPLHGLASLVPGGPDGKH
ncbi:maltose alpha-D-glucosyltransferase [Caldimonas thermodepolymerans]|uniref:maltose alpha-D-glucosyltransferase n=1 Tax=Caldimonas thermodepolymerans TaxID=215580 RepID=UPI0022360864|nr:maltose alpha-D-glucosyltransferase [Caldimonas thermodepolymerans]UZG42699.1 maltose alpha-D-glucosyltransferase [Caldimonas thermodepolymerans]